jgi:hypothetical protein
MKELLLIGMFIVSIVLFGLSYATVIKFVSDDIYNKFKDNITNIFIIDSVLIFLLMVSSVILIKNDINMFQPYILLISHVTLLVALLSLSFSIIKITN